MKESEIKINQSSKWISNKESNPRREDDSPANTHSEGALTPIPLMEERQRTRMEETRILHQVVRMAMLVRMRVRVLV